MLSDGQFCPGGFDVPSPFDEALLFGTNGRITGISVLQLTKLGIAFPRDVAVVIIEDFDRRRLRQGAADEDHTKDEQERGTHGFVPFTFPLYQRFSTSSSFDLLRFAGKLPERVIANNPSFDIFCRPRQCVDPAAAPTCSRVFPGFLVEQKLAFNLLLRHCAIQFVSDFAVFVCVLPRHIATIPEGDGR